MVNDLKKNQDKYPNGNLIIGATTGAWAINKPTGIIIDEELNYVTPKNDFKQTAIHSDNSNV